MRYCPRHVSVRSVRCALSHLYSEAKHIRVARVDLADDLKKRGFGSVAHKPAITPEDLAKLFEPDQHTFDTNNPTGLQNRVWFNIMFFICRRGRENVREMYVLVLVLFIVYRS